MALISRLFRGDSKLEACLVDDSAHLTKGATGDHIAKVQAALLILDGATIEPTEIWTKRYGASTAAAVLSYKTKRQIINYSYQTQPDNIVGKMTIAFLDREMHYSERGSVDGNYCAGAARNIPARRPV